MIKKIHHTIKFKIKHFFKSSTLFISVILSLGLLTSVFAFIVIKENTTSLPHISELAFIEKSSSKDISGSVVPASCESNPPSNDGYGHASGCPDIIQCSSGNYTVSTFQCWYYMGEKNQDGSDPRINPDGARLYVYKGTQVRTKFTSLSEVSSICNSAKPTTGYYGFTPTYHSFSANYYSKSCVPITPCVQVSFSPISPCTSSSPATTYADMGEVYYSVKK